jgi:DNA-directed RNA polymerase specialized sigma24 family protein/CheY-like chemotaxis protein
MTQTSTDSSFSDRLAAEVPYLRRYARALTGTQAGGDQYTVTTLEAILQDRSSFDNQDGVRVNLFKCFHAIWSTTGQQFAQDHEGALARAHAHLASLTNNSREALLLNTIEDFSLSDIAKIMNISDEEAKTLVDGAIHDLAASAQGRIMIIEDEPIIAVDLQSICEDLGHTVTSIARTRAEAVENGKRDKPDLILADIQLADNSSGIDAVNDLLKDNEVPVIFITAFPERLLTGNRPEPAFMISKPFRRDQVRSAVSQAMFFRSTETLKA